ncbi:sugar ABC transporter substrate-binding protein [Paenibacillus kobensis]|uniref:sugar ABC transporter substrate-binding protein n=1 Tax=Paenibacillus kobensis TaxID=59841 RepID=UPI000FD8D454|nr:maltose ABC transporter substrate-binding protein [Paenibacillus kobensis]
MKKWVGLMIVSTMVFMLAACGNTSKSGDTTTATDTAATSETTATTDKTAADTTAVAEEELQPEDGASLIVWDSKTGRAYIDEMAKQFEEKYGVPVKVEEVESPEQVNKLTTDGPAGLGADLVNFPNDQLGRAVSAGLVLENDVFGEETANASADNAVKAVSYDDVLYGYPRSVETYAMIYNKTLFPEGAPKSFEDIVTFAKTYNDTKNNKFAIMWEIGNFYFNYGFLAATGGYLFGDGGTKADDIGLNNDGAVQGAKFYASLKDIIPMNTGDVTYDIKKGLFTGGTLGIDINGPWTLPDYKASGVDYGVAPLPTISGKPMVSFSGVKAWYVNSFTKYPNAAKLFAKFVTSKEAQLKEFEMNGILPANKEAAADSKVQGDAVTKAFLDQFNVSQPMPSIPEMGNVWNPAAAALSEVWNDGKDAKASLDNAVQQIKDANAVNSK